MTENKDIEQDSFIRSVPQTKCYICESVGKTIYSSLNDRTYGSKGLWSLSKCTNPDCGLFWLDPMPLEEDIWKAYKTYYTHANTNSAILPFLRPLEKGYLNIKYGYYSESIKVIQKIMGVMLYLFPTEKAEVDFSVMYLNSNPGGKLLDVGCGNGWFLIKMRELEWSVSGVDFDSKAVEFCKSQNLNVGLGTLQSQNYPDDYFDIITINHVIEHVYDPFELLKECHRILKKNGTLIIETPNTNSWLHKYIYKENWFPLEPPRHIMIFNPQNLDRLVRKAGFISTKAASAFRNEFWVYLVSRSIKKTKYFALEGKRKPIIHHIIGRSIQFISWFINIFNKNWGGETLIIAKKL